MSQISVVIPCLNPEETLSQQLALLSQQESDVAGSVELILANDGTDPFEPDSIPNLDIKNIKLRISNEQRGGGRGRACNRGIALATGELIWIMDSDCLPKTPYTLSEHLRALDAGADISIGGIESTTPGFWTQFRLERNRLSNEAGIQASSTANCLIRKSLLRALGGFHSGYKGYGFEDRDFLLNASASGAKILWTPRALVQHDDRNMSVREYCHKMNEAARVTAPVFAARHPDHYQASNYAMFDARAQGPIVAASAKLAKPFAYLSMWLADRLLHYGCLPFSLRRRMMNMAGAFSYLLGSVNIHFPRSPT